jgi:hypothetical protein
MTTSLKFVDSIAASPATRLDLADVTTWRVVRDGTSFPPPPLRRVVAQTLLRDGAIIPSSAYDLRDITLDLTVDAVTADATATALQSLYRELDRPGGNLLRWQHETTHPVFFRTFRASAAAVDVRPGGSDGRKKRVLVDLLAEPFALGLREDPVSLVTVSTNPAAGSNGCFVDVTGVKGDVEAPAFIRWPDSAITAAGQQSVFAVRRRGTPSAAPFLFQAEAATQGTDTTTQVNDANFSGSGNNYSRTTFATTTTMVARLTVTDLGTASVDLRGRYRVFLRYRKNTTSDGINLELRWGDTSGFVTITNDAFVTPNTTNITTADLGEVTIPAGGDPVTDPSGTELSVSDSYRFRLMAERTSGSGSIDFDFLLFVPADDRLAIVQWPSSALADRWLLDARDNSVHARDSSDRVVSAWMPAVAGGLSMLTPNQTNRIYMLQRVEPTVAWALTTVTNVSVSYWPRYLSVRPAST